MTNDLMINEWENEPDYMHGIYFDLPCFIRRNESFGTLNGYVGLPKTHRFYQVDYVNINEHVDVHGGLTFSTEGKHQIFGLCWWVGFDCNHAFDFSPGMFKAVQKYRKLSLPFFNDLTYRNMQYVQDQCIQLAYTLSDQSKIICLQSPFKCLDNIKGLGVDG